MAIHGSGVWFVQITRPLTRYQGPSWLIGYSSYPICGGMGLTSMAAMCVVVMTVIHV